MKCAKCGNPVDSAISQIRIVVPRKNSIYNVCHECREEIIKLLEPKKDV